MRRTRLALTLLSIAIVGRAAWLTAAATAPRPAVTFSETIAPIVFDKCVTCHRPGEAAPFSLM